MTIVAAWVRDLDGYQELMFASDSRIRGGRVFDYCPKLMRLPRSDCALAFAGDDDGYPMMQQISNAIAAHGPATDGAIDLTKMCTHVVRVANSLLDSIQGAVPAMRWPKNVELVFGGYSWLAKAFRIWRIAFDTRQRRFNAYPAFVGRLHASGLAFARQQFRLRETTGLGRIAFAGDLASTAMRRLHRLVGTGANLRRTRDGDPRWDMEPFAVIRDMLLDAGVNDTIGGPPQLLKVHQHLNVSAVGVYWRARAGSDAGHVKPFLLGRPLLDYERTEQWNLDAFSFRMARDDISADAAANMAKGMLIRTLARRL